MSAIRTRAWPQVLNNFRKKRSAAALFRRDWTRMSRTSPLASTARQNQCLRPLSGSTTSSRCHVSAGLGRSRRILAIPHRGTRQIGNTDRICTQVDRVRPTHDPVLTRWCKQPDDAPPDAQDGLCHAKCKGSALLAHPRICLTETTTTTNIASWGLATVMRAV